MRQGQPGSGRGTSPLFGSPPGGKRQRMQQLERASEYGTGGCQQARVFLQLMAV